VLAGHLADLLFDRWSDMQSAPQLERDVHENARLPMARPAVLVEAVVGPALKPAVYRMPVSETIVVSGIHAAGDIEHVTISSAHARTETVSVSGARATQIETLLAPEGHAPSWQRPKSWSISRQYK